MKLARASVAFGLLCAFNSASAEVNAWTRVGPDGGSVYSLEYLGASDSIVLAATMRGIYRSENRGQHWRRAFQYPHASNGTASIAIAVNPANPQQVLMISSAIFRSSDGGNTWNFAPSPYLPRGTPTSIAFSRSGTVVWIGTNEGEIFLSSDSGSSWQARSDGLRTALRYEVSEIEVDAADSNVAYARFSDGLVYRTVDGSHWAQLPGGDTYRSIAAAPLTPGAMIGLRSPYPFISSNYGDTWLQSTLPGFYQVEYSPDTPGRAMGLFQGHHLSITGSGGFMWFGGGALPVESGLAIAIQPGDPDSVLVSGSLGIHASADGGDTWADSIAGIQEATFGDLVVAQDGSDFIYGPAYDANSVYRRDPTTGQWLGVGRASSLAAGMPGPVHFAITTAPGDSNTVYIVRAGRFARSSDAGVTWTQLGSLNADSLSFDRQNPQIGYATSYSAGIRKTTDGGAIWTPINTGLTSTSISEVIIDPANSEVLYAGSRFTPVGVFKSIDGGANWAPANVGMETATIFTLAFEPGNPAVLYAGTGIGVFKSVNAGASWVNLSLQDPRGIIDLAIDPIVPSNVHAIDGGLGRVLRSVDAGATWELIDNPITESGISGSSLALLPSRPNVIVASIYSAGLFEMEIAPDLRLSSNVSTLTADTAQSVVLSVQNAGPHAASRVRFAATLPAADGQYSVQTNKGTCAVANQQLTCDLGALPQEAGAAVTVAFTPADAGTPLVASVSAHETDPTTGNNSVSLPTQPRIETPAPPPPAPVPDSGGKSGGGGGGSFGWLLLGVLGWVSGVARRTRLPIVSRP